MDDFGLCGPKLSIQFMDFDVIGVDHVFSLNLYGCGQILCIVGIERYHIDVICFGVYDPSNCFKIVWCTFFIMLKRTSICAPFWHSIHSHYSYGGAELTTCTGDFSTC